MEISHKKIKDAVNSLILSNPLFAAILIQQKFEACENYSENPTCSVNGQVYRFNSAFCDSCTFDENKGIAAHEGAHLLGLDHVRMGNRDPELWNIACDHVNNLLLLKEGFKFPAHILDEKGNRIPAQIYADSRFSGMSKEDTYRQLKQEKKDEDKQNQSQSQKPSQAGKQGQGQGQNPSNPNQIPSCGQVKPNPASAGNPAQAQAKAKAQVEKAMSIARMAGQLSGSMERAIHAAETPRFDWNEILHRFFQEFTANDYSFSVPNKRFVQSGLILPSLRSRDLGKIILAIDTSGSVSESEVSAMVAEMQNCMETYCENGLADGLTVIYCDSQIQGIETLFSGDKANPKGGGGTWFSPVFNHLQNDLGNAACLVYLTDGYCSESMADLETIAPSFPVMWGLIQDNPGFNPPFGEVFKMDIYQ